MPTATIVAPPAPLPPPISPAQYRTRIEYEDQLAYTRFNLVLVVNGFAAVAVGFPADVYSKLLIAGVMIVLNVLGGMAIRTTDSVVAGLTHRFRREHKDPVEEIVQSVLGRPDWRRPNRILLRLFPLVLTLGWVAGFIVALFALR